MTIGFTGDVMIGRLVNDKIRNTDSSYVWGNVLPLLKSTDLNIINLEAALTRSTDIVPKIFNFKSDPEHVSVLSEARIDVVNLANNHVLDYDISGLWDTIKMLDKAGIYHVGAGQNATEAAKPVILTKNNLRLGILGFTDNEPGWQATNDSPGINYLHINDIESVIDSIQKIRRETDIVIVSLHWGPNMREKPNNKFIDFAHKLVNSGVDIIHGHSAHIFQGVEWYKGKLIMYDTGDFVDDYRVDPGLKNNHSFLFLCKVSKEAIDELKLIPVLISNYQVNLAMNADREWSLARMKMLCSQFGTQVLETGEVKMK